MKNCRQTAAKPKPISAPENWQCANLTRLCEIVVSHPDWVEQTARRVGRLPIEDLQKAEPTTLGEIIVLLNAQALYWRKQAHLLDTPRNRARVKKEFARKIAEKMMANVKSPDATKLAQEMRTLNAEGNEMWPWVMALYNWAASAHESAALRSALGYSESQFRVLAKKEIQQLEHSFGSKYLPMSVERKGQETIYSPMVACGLLIHKLAKINMTKRAGLIELLLQIGKLPPPLRKLLSLRRS